GIERRIDGDDRQRFAAAGLAGQVVLGDIDLAVAEDRTDFADHAGNVFVDDVEQRSFRLELDAEVVDRDDALVFLAEQRRRNAGLVARGRGAKGDEVRVVAGHRMRRRGDGDAAL